MKLERIKIEGYKSIRELDLELRPLNILIGANGAGKSNFISAFHMLYEILNERFQIYVARNSAEMLLHFGSKTTKELHIEVWFGTSQGNRVYGYEIRLLPTNTDSLIFQREKVSTIDERNIKTVRRDISGGNRESVVFDATSLMTTTYAELGKALSEYKVYHFHDTSPEARIKKTVNVDDNKFLRPDGSNLAAFLYRLKQTKPEYYRRIVKTIRLAAPYFDDFDLEPSRVNADIIRLEWHEYGWDTYLNANVLSDGTLRFICLCTLLLQPELPSVILIDEPELGLHPYAITLLAEMLISAAKQTQIIVTTQSVSLINHFTPEDVVVVDRKNHQSTFKRVNSDELTEWLEEYSLGELWEKNIIGGRPSQRGA